MKTAVSRPRTFDNRAKITAVGTYVPERRLSNADLEQMVETNDAWIVERTGIRERRICGPGQNTSDLCILAVQNMIDRFAVQTDEIDLIIVCTSTPDFTFPSTACLVQNHFRIPETGAFDLSAACAGFMYGLHTAFAMINADIHRKVLVIGADALSKITDYTDRKTCILFGDGAGAVLVERDERLEPGRIAYVQGADGGGGLHTYRACTADVLHGQPVQADGRIIQNGREVYRFAVQTVTEGVQALLRHTGIHGDEVDWFIPHSANLRIIESICEKTGLPLAKTLHTIEHYGNTSAATIPLALDKGISQGLIKEGQHVLMYGFGGGLVHAGMLLPWR